MSTLRSLLGNKSARLYDIEPDALVLDALKLMADRDIGIVLVTEAGRLIGTFTERDYARKVMLQGKSSREVTVRELMSRNPIVVKPDTTLDDVMALMTTKRVRYLPIMEGETLVGIVSIGDVVKQIILEQKFNIEALENYLTGSEYGG